MATEKTGVWLIGAWGGVSTTVAVGLAALQNGLSGEAGLVSSLPMFSEADLIDWSQIVIGGHEIRETSYAAEAATLQKLSNVFSESLLEAITPTLTEYDQNIQPGTLINVGETIASFATGSAKSSLGESPSVALERIGADLIAFRDQHSLSRVIVVNLASTEPPVDDTALNELPTSWSELAAILDNAEFSPIPASSLYAIAALQNECAFVNFTPSVGSGLPAICDLAEQNKLVHVGRDGKTGETLLKSVLAPMFAARNLQVMSWVGHNIFGNMDGKVLDDPVNKANKVHSKDHLLTEILGYKPQSLVSIEYIESMADWKTAWDHIHFQGFLGTKMIMQFTWQGCDSLLAAPLVLDLVRLTEREWRRGGTGVMTFLSSFFKSPLGENVPPEFSKQYQLLEEWVQQLGG
ncbi:MAG: inositol-3-phosphate synthase [Planctomycetaceae bacterium]